MFNHPLSAEAQQNICLDAQVTSKSTSKNLNLLSYLQLPHQSDCLPILISLTPLVIHVSLSPAPSANRDLSHSKVLQVLLEFLGNPKDYMSYQFLNCLRLLQGICHFYLSLRLQSPALETPHPWATSTLSLQTTTPTVLFLCQQALCSGWTVTCSLHTAAHLRPPLAHGRLRGPERSVLKWESLSLPFTSYTVRKVPNQSCFLPTCHGQKSTINSRNVIWTRSSTWKKHQTYCRPLLNGNITIGPFLILMDKPSKHLQYVTQSKTTLESGFIAQPGVTWPTPVKPQITPAARGQRN